MDATDPSSRRTSAAFLSKSHSLFHQDIDRWKDLYVACQDKLEQLRALQVQIEESAGASDEACEARRCWEELRAEVEAASQTLSQEQAYVQDALVRHGAVLVQLLQRLQGTAAHPGPTRPSLEPSSSAALSAVPSEPPPKPEVSAISAAVSAISKETIGLLKDLIREHEMLTASVEEERAKYQEKFPAGREPQDPLVVRATEDKLRRTNGLLQLQVKRLQYELSRLSQAQATEMAAVNKLTDQASAELQLNLAHEKELAETHRELKEGARFVFTADGCQQLYRHGSRHSFVGQLEDAQRRRERQARLEHRLHSDRVYREVELVDDQADDLHRLAEDLDAEMEAMNEAERSLQATWHALRQERDELTAHLYPDQQRLQELQEIAKEKLELDTKLHKENFLFKRQLEDFQKDLLEVETDLLTGNINRRARATKNIVTQLMVLRDCIAQQNEELWQELRDKKLSVSPSDSLASAVMAEEDFRQQITDKMKKMELRIKEDLDRRALFRPKKFVFEPPGAAKVPFRGQRNVIKVPSKVAADWRRKTTFEMRRQDAMERQVEKLRRDILNKLSLEKEKAKQQLLQYESQRHSGPLLDDDVKATQELRAILGQLDDFLHRARRSRDADPNSSSQAAAPHEVELEEGFGREMRNLVLQLEKLQSALQGGSARERGHKATALERGRQLFNQLPDAGSTGPRRYSSESSREAPDGTSEGYGG